MPMQLNFDDGTSPDPQLVYAGDIGTTKAWGNFGRWTDTLPAKSIKALGQLWEYGYTDDPDGLEKQLARALQRKDVPANVRKTGEIILALVKTRGKTHGVYVTSGD